MILLSNQATQTLLPGQSLIFDEPILHSGCGECHRRNSSSVKLRANKGVYTITFSGNVAGATAGDILQLAVQLSGSTLPETTIQETVATANAFNHISTTTAVRNCCGDYDRVTVTNVGTTAVTVGANAALLIVRNS